MEEKDRELLSEITGALGGLLAGELPREIDAAGAACGADVGELCENVNRLIRAFGEARQFILSLSEGKLEVEVPRKNLLVSPFKQLHANLRHLIWQTQQITKGDLNQRVDFLGEFSASFNEMIASLKEKKQVEDALQRANERLEHQAMTDVLTGIPNRLKFNTSVDIEISMARRHEVPLSLIMIDIDDFKHVNDTCGHHIGDLVLRELSSLILASKRPEDMFARWGGEEFVLLLPHTDSKGAGILAGRLREKVEQKTFSGVGRVTCSFGVSQLREGDDDNSFLRRADEALYRAKAGGKNRVDVETDQTSSLF